MHTYVGISMVGTISGLDIMTSMLLLWVITHINCLSGVCMSWDPPEVYTMSLHMVLDVHTSTSRYHGYPCISGAPPLHIQDIGGIYMYLYAPVHTCAET